MAINTSAREDRSENPSFHSIHFCNCTRPLLSSRQITLSNVLIVDNGDPYKCIALLNSGRWLDPTNLRKWQPRSCTMHSYKPKEATTCFSGRRIVLAGDSMIRETFWALTRQLASDSTLPVPSQIDKHSDLHFTIQNVTLDFYWDPYMNGTGYENAFNIPDNFANPAMTIVGTGLWYAKNVGTDAFGAWRTTIDDIVNLVQGRKRTGREHIIILPLLEPDWPRLAQERRSITPDMLNRMNSHLEELSAKSLANVAFSFKDMLSTAAPETTHDKEGLHLVDEVTSTQAQLLINLRCNDNRPKSFPFDSTCCYKYPPNYQELALFALVLVLISIVYYLKSLDILHKSYVPSESVLRSLLIFVLVLVYAFLADRTHLFGKESKHFSLDQICILVLVIGIVGYLTLETAETNQAFLSRDQTDEWKGWMQICILIYHYFGASKVSWIYNVIRVFVAMYLFMTGFGHTVFFYKKADYSFSRVVTVLVRLNLLNVVLAYTMNTDYLFYYFSPLVSFWFGVIWLTMRINHERNCDMRFLGVKFAISAILVTIFTKTPGILERMFFVLKAVARIRWDAVEWRFRVGLDMWIVYIGMTVAILFIRYPDYRNSAYWERSRTVALRVSIVTIPAYLLFEATRQSKFVYNHWHPYISLFPILAFVVLRNSSTRLRNTHSAAFAFIGRCSLETFILQFHIWLAGDTKSILVVIGPSRWRWVSFTCGSVLFVFLSWKVAAVVGIITEWMTGNKKTEKRAPVSPAPLVSGTEANKESQDEVDVEKIESPVEHDDSLLPVPISAFRRLSYREKLGRVMVLYWEDLRVRTGFIVTSLWLLNLVRSLPSLTKST